MKKISGKKKKVMIVLGILLAIILLVPYGTGCYHDGGTVEYCAILYSVKLVHAIPPREDDERDYVEGTEVKILGVEVFDNVDWEKEN